MASPARARGTANGAVEGGLSCKMGVRATVDPKGIPKASVGDAARLKNDGKAPLSRRACTSVVAGMVCFSHRCRQRFSRDDDEVASMTP